MQLLGPLQEIPHLYNSISSGAYFRIFPFFEQIYHPFQHSSIQLYVEVGEKGDLSTMQEANSGDKSTARDMYARPGTFRTKLQLISDEVAGLWSSIPPFPFCI
jgi:hypothetical protein